MKHCLKGAAIVAIVICLFAVAAEAQDQGKFMIVPGSGDNAYLLNTQTGAVWVLTQRTLTTGTGREPVAIPYRFLYLLPDPNMFLDEDGKKVPVRGKK